MEQKSENLHDEINDLKEELEHFQREKERVRAIVGRIGGVPKFRTKLFNAGFIVVIAVSIVVSLLCGPQWRLLMIEFATVALSAKIIYLIHCQTRINHFKFWILSSIEWRLNEMMKLVRQLKESGK
jgi:Na+/H+ antiporter NhaD/arsenite permease-like protein